MERVAESPRLGGASLFERGNKRTEPLAACVVGLIGASLLAFLEVLVRHEPAPRGDDEIYERMALHPFGVHTFPFGYRIGLPLLVHLLPFSTTTGFLLLSWAAAGGAAAFAYLLMRQLGGVSSVAATLAILMCVSPPFLLVVIRQGRNPDIATVFFLMAATYFVVRRSYARVALTLVIGVAFREAVLFAVPLAYAVWATRPIDGRAFGRTVAVGLPAVTAYLGLRVGIQTVGETQVPGYAGSLVGARFAVIKDGLRTPLQEARRMATIYGPLWVISPLALRGMPYARRGLVLVALCGLAMTFALDWGRMMLLAAPVFYPAGAFVLSRRPGLRLPTYGLMLTLAIGYAFYMDVAGVQSGIVGNGSPPYPVQ